MELKIKDRLQNSLQELPRYFLVCTVSFSSDYASLYLLTEYVGLYYLYSAFLGFLIGNLVNYFLATKLVFKHRKLNSRYSESLIYVIIGFAVLPVHHGVLWFSTESLGFVYQISKLFASGVVFILIFILRKFFLF